MYIYIFFMGLLMIGLGSFARKYPFSFSGFNTISETDKALIDKEGLSKFLQKVLIGIGITLLAICIPLTFTSIGHLSYVVLIFIIFGGVLRIEYGSAAYFPEQFRKKRKFQKIALWVLTFVCPLYIGYGFLPTKITVDEQKIAFRGVEGTSIAMDKISNFELAPTLPPIKMRRQGFSISKVKKGKFLLADHSSAQLYVRNAPGPYLKLTEESGFTTYFNAKDSIALMDIYKQIEVAKARGYIVHLGDAVPAFSLTLPDGRCIPIDSLRGKVVMLQFTASWCTICQKEMPHIESEIWKPFRKSPDFALYGIDFKENAQQIQQFAQSIPISYPIALDEDGSIFELFSHPDAGVTRNVLINKEGRIIFLTRLYELQEFSTLKKTIAQELAK